MSIVPIFRLAFGAVLVLNAGCGQRGPDLAEVRGTVLLEGQPIAGATVEFTPEGATPSYGTTDAAGNYELRFARDRLGALHGKHKVRISTGRGEDPNGQPLTERIPAAFNVRSQLVREVAPGVNVFDFSLGAHGAAAKGNIP